MLQAKTKAPGSDRTFFAHSPGVLEQLPLYVSKQFDFQLTNKSGFTTRVLQLAVFLKNFSQTQRLLDELHHTVFYQAALVYYHYALHLRSQARTGIAAFFTRAAAPAAAAPSSGTSVPAGAATTAAFGDFDAPKGYAGYVLQVGALASAVKKRLRDNAALVKQALLNIQGRFLRADHTFQIAKHVRDDGVVSYQALFTVMNEHVQVVRQMFTETKSMDEVGPHLQAMMRTMHGKGFAVRLDATRCPNV